MLRHFERDETGLGTGHGICAQEFIGEDREAIDPHGFQSLIKRSGFTRSFDPLFDETKVFVEYGVLERDRQRENAVSQRWIVGRLSVSPPSGLSSRRPVRSTKLPNVVASSLPS